MQKTSSSRCASVFAVWAFLAIAFVNPLHAQEDLAKGVVKVSSEINGLNRTGTGFIVGLNFDDFGVYVVTAAHVVSGDSHPIVQFRESTFGQQRASVIKTQPSAERGLALLKVMFSGTRPSKSLWLKAASSISKGTKVEIVGMPRFAGDWTSVEGSVVANRDGALIVDAAIDEGNSGGPVFYHGDVVGVVGTVGGSFGRFTEVIASEEIRKFLEPLIGVRKGALDKGVVIYVSNYNSALVKSITGVWRYYYDGSLNSDNVKIFLDSGDVLRVDYAETSYGGTFGGVELNGDLLNYTFTNGGRQGKISVRVKGPNLLEGTFSDERGIATYKMERVR
jgi:Trypsin-like peptidase domain